VLSLTLIYTLIHFELRNKSALISDESQRLRAIAKKVTFRAFLICFFLWWIAVAYAIAGFVKIPPHMGKLATMAIQLCSGSTGIIYLVFNDTIRNGVKQLLSGRLTKVGTESPKELRNGHYRIEFMQQRCMGLEKALDYDRGLC